MPHLSWNESYAAGELPWDTGEPEPLLVEFVISGRVCPTRTLEIGAGTGTNALYLAERGFNVLGIDVAPLAVGRATAKLNGRDLCCRFAAVDFLVDSPVNGPFGFDSGGLSTSFLTAAVFMSSMNPKSARVFPRGVAAALAPGGLWLSLVGSTEGPPREVGPPPRSAREVILAIEPALEIVELRTAEFRSHGAKAWFCLARRRI